MSNFTVGNPMPHASFPQKVVFPDSVELVCFHEAGHVTAAVPFGVLATEVCLFDTGGGAPHGKTTLNWNGDQREAVACGGFAAERYLFDSGRLVDSSGHATTESDFIQFAVAVHAADDKKRYFGKDHSSAGIWPQEMDREFIQATKLFSRMMRYDVVTAIAEVLLAEKSLSRDRIASIIRTTIGDRIFDEIKWRDT